MSIGNGVFTAAAAVAALSAAAAFAAVADCQQKASQNSALKHQATGASLVLLTGGDLRKIEGQEGKEETQELGKDLEIGPLPRRRLRRQEL